MKHAFFALTIGTQLLLGLIACSTENTAERPTGTPVATTVEEPTATTVTPTEQPATDVPPIQAFEDQLMQALEQRDHGQLQGLMGNSFMIAGWRSEGTAYGPDGAVEQLQNNYLGQNTRLTFDPDRDLAALLEGMDPLSILGPDVRDPRAMFVSGWGQEGQDEAILYIAHDADGIPYWYGFLFSFGGFAPAAAGQVLDTDVEFVMAQVDVTMYAAPGGNAAVIGKVFDGQTARVTGVSADGGWWRVICPDDTVGDCWISADPGLTQPTSSPGG
jgi:hypothetical protein